MKELRVTLVSDDLPKGCGLETYARNLRIHLKKNNIGVQCSKTRKLFGNYPISLSYPVKTKIVHFTDQKSAAILFFSPFKRYKAVVTVHDMTEIINFNDIYLIRTIRAKIMHELWSWIIKKSLKKADAIIAVSEHTKNDIQKIIGPVRDVKVIYEAAGSEFRPQLVKKEPYSILYIGSSLAHKNLKTLLNAFYLVLKRLPKCRLILIGQSLPSDNGVKGLIENLHLGEKVVFKGYVEDTTKEYSKAGVFVFPSLYEGFGLPVLEAMACGCPVVCSNATSLPEVGGDAVIYFNTYDFRELEDKIYKTLTNIKLKNKIIKKGLARVKQFSWGKTAQETIQVYKKVLENSKK